MVHRRETPHAPLITSGSAPRSEQLGRNWCPPAPTGATPARTPARTAVVARDAASGAADRLPNSSTGSSALRRHSAPAVTSGPPHGHPRARIVDGTTTTPGETVKVSCDVTQSPSPATTPPRRRAHHRGVVYPPVARARRPGLSSVGVGCPDDGHVEPSQCRSQPSTRVQRPACRSVRRRADSRTVDREVTQLGPLRRQAPCRPPTRHPPTHESAERRLRRVSRRAICYRPAGRRRVHVHGRERAIGPRRGPTQHHVFS